jgi:hypothetical protein
VHYLESTEEDHLTEEMSIKNDDFDEIQDVCRTGANDDGGWGRSSARAKNSGQNTARQADKQ